MPTLRLTLCVALLAIALLPVAAAHAGGYDVIACDANVAGGANNSWAALADPGSTAYTYCPAGQGLVARNVYDNGTSTFLQGAYMIFDAPPGTYVESLAFEAGWRRNDCSWGTTIVAGNYDLNGSIIWGLPANQNCGAPYVASDYDFFPGRYTITVNAPRVRIETRCGSWSGCPRNGVSTMRLKDVDVRVHDDTPPTLANGRGALWTSQGWLSGTQAVGFDASDGSGIREADVLVDGKSVAQHALACDYTQRAPCPPASLDESFPTAGFGGDGQHTLTLQAIDAGGNPATATRTIQIDNTPPDPPQNLTLDGGDSWRSSNSFDLHWGDVPQQDAPIAGAQWELCPAGGGACTTGSRDGDGITSLSGLTVPAAGDWTLTLWLRDAAGNQDERLSAPPVHLRFDNVSPELAFDPISADDPTLISVATSDEGSGVTGGEIDVRRQGSAAWRALPTSLQGTQLVARLDDQDMGDGVYELQATATDAAGNEKTTTQRADGSTALMTLPVRLKTSLRAGVLRRHDGRVHLARSAFVRYGQLVRVRGRLTSTHGNPMQDVVVNAYTRVRGSGGPARLVATVKTSRTGRFSFLVRRGPSRTIEIAYSGTSMIRSAMRVVVLNVRSSTTLRPSGLSLTNGDVLTLSGRIRTGRIPSQGKLVELQVLIRGRWRTFATARASRRGRWHYDYRFDGTRGNEDYRFRAEIPPEQGYPFATGRSRVVRVHVTGN